MVADEEMFCAKAGVAERRRVSAIPADTTLAAVIVGFVFMWVGVHYSTFGSENRVFGWFFKLKIKKKALNRAIFSQNRLIPFIWLLPLL